MALTKIPSSLLDTSGGFDLQGNITLGDNEQIQLGDSSDLQIYHDGSNNYIQYTSGNLILKNSTADFAVFNSSSAAVELYFNASKKFETTSTGATVTGNLAVTGDLDITGNVNSYNVTDLDVTDQTITLGAGQTEANSGGSGIIVDGSNASILWDETTDGWVFNKQIGVNADDCTTASSLSNIVVGEYADTASGIVLRGTTASALNFEDNSSVTAARVYYNHADGYMAFNTEQTEGLRIDSSQNATFAGTISSGKITISADAGNEQFVIQRATSTNEQLILGFHSSDYATIQAVEQGVDWRPLALNPSGGNVGIGTTNPQTDLNIVNQSGATLDINTNLAGADSKILLHEGTSASPANGASIRYDGANNLFKIGVGSSVDTTRLVIERDTGNVGIGTDNPDNKLHVVGQASFQNAGNTNRGNIILGPHGSGTSKWSTLGGTHYNDSTGSGNGSGNAGCMIIGCHSQSGSNEVYVGGGPYELNPATAIRFYTYTATTHNLGGSERMRITNGGSVLFGKTSASASATGIHINNNGVQISVVDFTSTGTAKVYNNNNATGTTYSIQYRQNNSTVGSVSVGSSSTAYNTSSDYRLKENVVEMDGALDRVNQLKPKRFNFIVDADTTVDGFLAHEVSDIVPEAITGVKDEVDEEGNPVYQGIDQSKLVPLLTKAIQEQQTIIDDLKARITELENT